MHLTKNNAVLKENIIEDKSKKVKTIVIHIELLFSFSLSI